MTPESLAYWLQGFFELSEATTLNERQTKLIKQHLHMVFLHSIDPSIPDPDGKLQAAHDGVTNHNATHDLLDQVINRDEVCGPTAEAPPIPETHAQRRRPALNYP